MKMERTTYSGRFDRNLLFTGMGDRFVEGEGRHIGGFLEGKREGAGVFIDLKGNKFEGVWCNDKLEGQVKQTSSRYELRGFRS